MNEIGVGLSQKLGSHQGGQDQEVGVAMPSTGSLPPVGPENGASIILSVVIVTEQFEVIGQSTEESDAKVG